MTRPSHHRPTSRNLILHVLLQPIYWTAFLFQRVCGIRAERRNRLWEARLNYKLFLQGLPTLFGLTLIGVLAGLSVRESFRREEAYSDAARSAFDGGDYAKAALFYERLTNLEPDVVHFRYNLGIASAQLGNEARAAAILDPLAPRDRLGYPPAHLWIAARLLREQPRPSADHLNIAEVHFLRLRRESSALANAADEGLTEIYAHQGRVDEILKDPRLHAAAKRRPDVRLLLARTAAAQGRTAEAVAEARELVTHFRRRVDDFPHDDEARRQLCETYGLLGEEAALLAVLRSGATIHPDGPFGSQLAELLTARALRVGNSPTATAAEKVAARREAIQMLDRYGMETPRSQLLAGQLARLGGDTAEAERRYRAIVDELPSVRIELADLYRQSNRMDEARREWEAYVATCRKTLEQSGKLTNEERLLVAIAAGRLGNFDDAERWLLEAARTPEVAGALAQLYTVWWDKLIESQPEATNIELLRKGLQVDRWNPPLLARLLTAARDDGPRGVAARADLKEMVAVGELPAPAYVLLGTDAYERGDRETAQRYLEQARRLDPKSAVALNNLAWTLLTGDKPDPAAALAPAEAAVVLAPSDPHFRDTRFRILVKLGQWNRALEDLEFCASAMAGNREFHRAAAEVYDHLKLPDLAAEHRRLAGDR